MTSLDAPLRCPGISGQPNMKQQAKSKHITSLQQEGRTFAPPKEFSKQAHIKSMAEYKKLWTQSIKTPDTFWGKIARNELVWFKPFNKELNFL